MSEDTCDHVATISTDLPAPGDVCPQCAAEGTTWVHLRQCAICGQVGCCDSSPRRHARRHWHDTGHAMLRNAEPGPQWLWCYEHGCYTDEHGNRI